MSVSHSATYTVIRQTLISHSGLTIQYSEQHRTPLDRKQVLLVLGSSLYYPRCIPDDIKSRFRVVFLDLPHFTQPDPSFSLDNINLAFYLSLIGEACETLSLQKVVLVGHSHHGNVALEFAKHEPRRVAGLVMIGSPPANVSATQAAQEHYWQAQATPARKSALASGRERFEHGTESLFSEQERYISAYVHDAPLYWFDKHYNAAHLWEGMNFSMQAVSAFRTFFEDYHFSAQSLDIPILVVMGRYDFAVPHVLWDEHKNATKRLSYHVLDKSGHTPSLEESDAFSQLLTHWLAQNSLAKQIR